FVAAIPPPGATVIRIPSDGGGGEYIDAFATALAPGAAASLSVTVTLSATLEPGTVLQPFGFVTPSGGPYGDSRASVSVTIRGAVAPAVTPSNLSVRVVPAAPPPVSEHALNVAYDSAHGTYVTTATAFVQTVPNELDTISLLLRDQSGNLLSGW